MSEELTLVTEQEPKQEAAQQQVSPQTAQVTQIVNNAIAALMDTSNLLRDLPKLVETNQRLASKLVELGALDPKTGLFTK